MPNGQVKHQDKDTDRIDRHRRHFLRTSVYAAYATPLITALLVAENSAAASPQGKCSPRWCHKKGLNYPCC